MEAFQNETVLRQNIWMAPDVCSDKLGKGQVTKNTILMGEQILSYAHTAHMNNFSMWAGITAVVSMKTLTRQYACDVILRNVRLSIFVVESNKYCIFWVCLFVALVMQHINRMRRIILPSVTVCLCNIFPHYLIKGTIFGKKLLNVKCLFWFSLQILYEMFIILRRNQRDIIINIRRSLCKIYVTIFRFWWNLNCLDTVSKNTEMSNMVEIGPVGDELFHAHRRTDMTKLLVAFRNFANAANKKEACVWQSLPLVCYTVRWRSNRKYWWIKRGVQII
jgi:hypothetical protein